MHPPGWAAQYTARVMNGAAAGSRGRLALLAMAVMAALSIGLFARDFWTPDEPREADIAWRMATQHEKAVPLLAGTPFCEKPPLTYWVAGALLSLTGLEPWAARLPNLLYALLAALAVAELTRRAAGAEAALPAAALTATFLLGYQVSIWLATDAPLLAFDALALLGLWVGYHGRSARERWTGYTLLHVALALGFLSKSAAAWLVPVLALLTLVVWERRPRELLRIELWAPLIFGLLLIGPWLLAVYRGSDGPAHLRVFFWNNLAGRFTHIDAPASLDYASGHRNVPGKYLIELPVYLFPWVLLVAAAVRRAWQRRRATHDPLAPAVRFAVASTLPTLFVLSLAATARNVYLAPALPGLGLLLGAWWQSLSRPAEAIDAALLRATAVLLALAVVIATAAAVLVGADAASAGLLSVGYVAGVGGGALTAGALLLWTWRTAEREPRQGAVALILAWCILLVAPAGPIYGQVDRWQDLAWIGRTVGTDARGHPLLLLGPDETTLAFMDLYGRPAAGLSATQAFESLPAPVDAGVLQRLDARLGQEPMLRVLVQLPGRR